MLLARRTLAKFSAAPPPSCLSRRHRHHRLLSNRASAVLSALDIPTTPTELPGVYDGEWKGSGDVLQSVCPATGEILANVRSVSFIGCQPFPGATHQTRGRVVPPQASPAELHGALERTREA